MEEDGLEELHDKYLETTTVLSKSFNIKEFKNYSRLTDKQYFKLLPKSKKSKILDIGCGQGHFLYYLLSKGYSNVSGIDISKDQVSFCKKHITRNVYCSDYESYLKEEKYDCIVMNEILEHIPKSNIIPCLRQVFGALKENGRAIIKVPNMRNPFNLAARYIDFTHEIGFTENSLFQVLKVSGFSNISIVPSAQENQNEFKNKPKKLVRSFTRKLFVVIIRNAFDIADRHPITGQPLNLFDKRIIGIAYKSKGE